MERDPLVHIFAIIAGRVDIVGEISLIDLSYGNSSNKEAIVIIISIVSCIDLEMVIVLGIAVYRLRIVSSGMYIMLNSFTSPRVGIIYIVLYHPEEIQVLVVLQSPAIDIYASILQDPMVIS